MVIELQIQCISNDVQLVLGQLGHECPGHFYRVNRTGGTGQAKLFTGSANKSHIKACVVCNQRPVAAELQKPGQLHVDGIGIPHHILPNPGQFGNARRNGLCGLYITVESIADFASCHNTGSDFDDLAVCSRETGGFGVKHHDFIGQQRITAAFDGIALLQIVDAVGFDAVQHFDIGTAFFQTGLRFHDFREGLHHAVIGDGQCLMSHRCSQFEGFARVAQGIHAGHIGM